MPTANLTGSRGFMCTVLFIFTLPFKTYRSRFQLGNLCNNGLLLFDAKRVGALWTLLFLSRDFGLLDGRREFS